MAKQVHVKLKQDSEWVEVSVANFYDPQKHHTVRLPGEAKKVPYALMQLPDGRIYDKINKMYTRSGLKRVDQEVNLGDYDDLTCLPFADDSVSLITADMVLQCKEKKNLVATMQEISRVLRPMGKAVITVPCWPSIEAISNPTYLTIFTPETFSFFSDNFKSQKQSLTRTKLNITFYR